MIKNVIYIEDGSVDLEELKTGLSEETKVIVYRQGSKPPVLIQPEKAISTKNEEQKLRKKAMEVRKELQSASSYNYLNQEVYKAINEAEELLKHFVEILTEEK